MSSAPSNADVRDRPLKMCARGTALNCVYARGVPTAENFRPNPKKEDSFASAFMLY